MRKVDRTGQRYGMLTVLEFAYRIENLAYWVCQCECGEKVIVYGGSLQSGHTRSCGCMQRVWQGRETHGMSQTREYQSHLNMKYRVLNPDHFAYDQYGGRGVRICERWMVLENFLKDMGLMPGPRYTIDRTNNDGHYSCGHCDECVNNNWPMNCQWLTKSENSSKRRADKEARYNVTMSPVVPDSAKTQVEPKE